MEKIDRRVIKTKKAIHNAVAELVTEKDVADITITDISERADINRKTFYSHYHGMHELMDEIENKIIADYTELIEDLDLRKCLENPDEIFKRLTDLIDRDRGFYGPLMSLDSNSNLSNKIAVSMKESLRETFFNDGKTDSQTLNVLLEFIFSGMVSVYRCWFNEKITLPIEDVSKIVSDLTMFGVDGVLGKE